MRRQLLQATLPLLEALLLLAGLLTWDPFRLSDRLLGGTGGEDVLKNVYRDSTTQETSNGEAPLAGLTQLAGRWCSLPTSQRFVLMGNSQTYTILLAPSERVSGAPEWAYPDRILQHESAEGHPVLGYRLAAPNLNYAEVLWYVHYLLARPCAAPERIIVQLNYESFRKLGVRSGMLELLSDPAFAAQAASEAGSGAAYASTFAQAINQHSELLARARRASAAPGSVSKTGISQGAGLGNWLETRARRALEAAPEFQARGAVKTEVLDTLYMLRVKVLGITPTTKRSLGGIALATSVSALERVGQLCQENHIKLEFFLAPQNPRATLYRTDADRNLYRRITTQLARQYAWRFVSLEDSIPESMWGFWADGPDPIHFGRAAHERMAQLLIASGLVPDGRS